MANRRIGCAILGLACTASAALAGAAEKRRHACRALAREPVLDGVVKDDPGWKGAAAEERFFKFASTEPPSRKTRFRIGCTDKALFIGVDCEEPETGKLRSSLPDMGNLWTEDSVEIFILPRGSDAYYQFIVNASGSRWNGIRGVSGVNLPLQNWQAKTRVAGNAWSVEMRIPWEVIRHVPGKDEQWGLNVCRNIVGAVGGTENVTWAHMQASFHEPENFGKLIFARKVSPRVWRAEKRRAKLPRSMTKVLLYSRPLGRKGKLGTFLQEGASRHRVSFVQGPHVAPRLSPDGKTVLLHSNRGGRTGVWLADRRGEETRRVCDGSRAEWSPDGKRIVFVRDGKVVERELASEKETVLSPEAWSSCRYASYSPDGRMLLVRSERGREKLYLVTPKDRGRPRALAEGDILSAPKFSPDAKRIAYQDGAHVYLFDVEKGTSTQLTLAAGVQSWPAWSRDGRTVYYCQRVEPYDEIGEIHSVAVDEPAVAGLIQKEVNPSFGWNGFVDGPVKKRKLAGARLGVGHGDGALGILKGEWHTEGWEAVPTGSSDMPLKREVLVENDWFLFSVSSSSGRLVLAPKEERTSAVPVEIVVGEEGGRGGGGITSIVLVKHDGDHAELKVLFASGRGGRMEAVFRVHRTAPAVEVTPVRNVRTVSVGADMSAVLLPDRYSNDLVLEPEKFRGVSRIALPRAPFVLGCTRGGGILVAPLDRRDAVVIRGKGKDVFEGLDVRTSGGTPLMIALLEGPLWQHVTEEPADEGAWDIKWAAPFPARWRLVAAGGGTYRSRMWDGPAPKGFEGPWESSMTYLYGRTGDTPLNVRTPVDVLRDVLGVRECEGLLDIEGVRGFRTADEWVPFLEISTRPHGWSPTLVHTKPGDLGILEAMMGIAGVDIEPVRALVRHLGDDIINLLDGLDGRIGEYETFVTRLRKRCRDSDARASAFMMQVAGQAEELQKRVAGLKVTALEDVRGAVDDVVKKGIKRGSWTNFRKEYKDLSSLSRAALSDRRKVLDAYREFAKGVRDEAGIEIALTPQLKEQCEAVRKMTRDVLRNRYYLEGDWRGEKPLRGGIR